MDDVIVVSGLCKDYGPGAGRGRAVLHRCTGRGLRPPRAQRGRQDHHGRDPDGHRDRTGREACSSRLRSGHRGRDYRERIGVVLQERRHSTRSSPSVSSSGCRRRCSRGERDPDELIEPRRPGGQARCPDEDAVRRAAAPARPGAGSGRGPPAVPGRAEDRIRPVGPPPRVGPASPGCGAWHDHPAHHPLHGRGGDAGGPGGRLVRPVGWSRWPRRRAWAPASRG